ncbi:2-hydroxychromene-2-carboxylate isomerase [Amphritea sp. 2_MG-2023]|uniref:2-hydroxychromene-2-carboxylate isomerase n=1 Tax=Amphritea TaxID=515417 RepID=UPI001C0767CF|nr:MULTISPECIES: 2-hydroxychromene-2-carboxylate isomerase [Amphritea]MBU2967703.1 2-hydroxychromene-2-carboxylate isomerase [Amphritea atlantica]MDO6416979.1 2-hydroxychromene-2-carboxylate isomerase [Amphritea sp. 2_MG-2023]
MTKTIDFYYDYISIASYLAWTQLEGISERTGARIHYKPMLLGGVFNACDNISPITIPAKWAWVKKDIQRYADHYGVPYQLNPHFPFSTVNAMRGALWAQAHDQLEAYNQAMFTAAWVDGKDLSAKPVLEEVLNNAGFDAAIVMDAITQPDVKTALIDATQAATARGVFGAPSMFVADELFFGQDRLEWVEKALC